MKITYLAYTKQPDKSTRLSVVSYDEWKTIFYKGIMPSEKVLDLPMDCNTLTGSVNL